MTPALINRPAPGIPSAPEDLGQGIWHFRARIWDTATLVCATEGAVVVCDPAFAPPEITRIREFAQAVGSEALHVLVTHADPDHICGLGSMPDATVHAGLTTRMRIDSGSAAAGLVAAGEEWGLSWPGGPRVDRVVSASGEATFPVRLRAFETPGHQADGLAYHLVDAQVMLVGDYISTVTYPAIESSLRDAIRTYVSLLEAVASLELRWIVPGHGPPLRPAEAQAVGTADLAYLMRLAATAQEAVDAALAPAAALLHVFGVAPPRATTPDFDIYGLRVANARRALDEARSRA